MPSENRLYKHIFTNYGSVALFFIWIKAIFLCSYSFASMLWYLLMPYERMIERIPFLSMQSDQTHSSRGTTKYSTQCSSRADVHFSMEPVTGVEHSHQLSMRCGFESLLRVDNLIPSPLKLNENDLNHFYGRSWAKLALCAGSSLYKVEYRLVSRGCVRSSRARGVVA